MLTPEAVCDIGQVWRDVRPRLGSYLVRLGSSPDQAEDLVQEVALRALRARVHFFDAEDLLRWCYVVGRNVYIDHVRSAGRQPVEPLAEGFDRPDVHDLEAIVESRESWTAVIRGAGMLSLDDRVALFAPLFDEASTGRSRTEATKLAVRRHRARGRLRAVLEAAVVVLGGFFAQLRGWVRRGSGAAVVLTGAAVVAASVLSSPAPATASVVPQDALRRAVQVVHPPESGLTGERSAGSRPTLKHPRSVSPGTKSAIARPDVSIAVSNSGFGARSGTTPRKGRQIVCIGLAAGRDDVCIPSPTATTAGSVVR